jgi:hypothetical protein
MYERVSIAYRWQSAAFLWAATCLAIAACGGATTSGPGEDNVDAGDHHDAGVTNDAGVTGDAADAGRPECDSSVVTCRTLPPTCPPGEIPVVAGACWAGHCARPSACRTVRDCTACNADNVVCATDAVRGAPSVRCVDVPAACATDRTCRCLASYVCTNGPFVSCTEVGSRREFSCQCPNC